LYLDDKMVKKPKIEQSPLKSSFKDDTVSGMKPRDSHKRNIFKKGKDDDLIKRRQKAAEERKVLRVSAWPHNNYRKTKIIY
jgi:hypothetical protein